MGPSQFFQPPASGFWFLVLIMFLWVRMLAVAIRLSWPDLLTPWRSPLLRWRMETYGLRDEQGRLLHAEHITPSRFFRFTVDRRAALLRFLRWAASL